MPSALSRAEIENVVTAAALAPSVLNIQPWRFVGRGASIELHRDPDRALPHSDPQSRSLTMSCGAALLNLRLAVAALGRRPETTLLPAGPDGTLLARVDAGEPEALSRTDARLFTAIPGRRTSRVPFLDEPLAPEAVLVMEAAATAEGTTLRVLDAYEMDDVGRLVRAADRELRYDDEIRAEVLAWTQRDAGAADGIPAAALGPAPNDLSSLVRDFAMGLPVERRPRADFEADPTLAVLLTDRDDPVDWIMAGQALERAWLEATAAGLAMSLLMQPLELAEMRWLARPSTGPAAPDEHRPYWPQALLRIGVSTQETPATPRRPLREILTVA